MALAEDIVCLFAWHLGGEADSVHLEYERLRCSYYGEFMMLTGFGSMSLDTKAEDRSGEAKVDRIHCTEISIVDMFVQRVLAPLKDKTVRV